MRKRILVATAAAMGAALAAPCEGRHILLKEGVGEVRRCIVGGVQLAEGRNTSWVTVTRTGDFTDPRYGNFSITRAHLEEMVRNFDARTYGQMIFIDQAHEPSHGAAGEIKRLAIEGDRLRALVEWTEWGRELIERKGFRYLSAEYHENWKDNEKGETHGCVLLGAGLVTRPCIKRLDPITLSEASDGVAIALHPTLLAELKNEVQTMWEKQLKALREQLEKRGLAEAVITSMLEVAKKALESVADEAAAVKLCEAMGALQLGSGAAPPAVNLQVTGLSEADVTRILAERDASTRKLAESLGAKRQLFASHLAEVGKQLSEETRKELCEAVEGVITADMDDAVIKTLAEKNAALASKFEAQRQLSAMGYQVQGSTYITVDESNNVKALQEAVDRRLGIASMPDRQRYAGTGGQLQETNRVFAEQVLSNFDQVHAARLHAEHRMLAGGSGVVSDVAVPASFERTVIREALYNLVGLQFVDVGTAQFSQSVFIPYSYRDQGAAGVGNTRVYEGGSVPRAGVKQTGDNAYPIPQKLAFEVSDELRYLSGNGQLNWDVLAENARNATRIIAEDTEQLIFNEVQLASDEYAVAAVTGEAVATANGTNRIWPLANFPVVRPRKIFDLQGNQVGNTLNPVAITLAGAAVTEWAPGVAAGTYYVLDYNLGEIRFVNASGAIITPTNGQAIVGSYSYTTNVFKFDTDLGTASVKEKWDDFLYRYGLRKSLIEDTRSHRCDLGLMSGTVMNSVERAGSFVANFSKPGTSLDAGGNLGVIKGVPNFKSYAPGLAMGDTRVIIGERALTRYRMLKPWQMSALENQKDANGRFTGKKEAYGDQFIALHTPTPLKAGLTSIALFSATTRVARAA